MNTYQKGDILLANDKKIVEYKGNFNHPKFGAMAKVRIYRTTKEVDMRFSDVTRFPFFAETKKC